MNISGERVYLNYWIGLLRKETNYAKIVILTYTPDVSKAKGLNRSNLLRTLEGLADGRNLHLYYIRRIR